MSLLLAFALGLTVGLLVGAIVGALVMGANASGALDDREERAWRAEAALAQLQGHAGEARR